MAQHDHGRTVDLILLVGEPAADFGRHAQHTEVPGGDALLLHVFGVAAGDEIDAHPQA